MTFYDITVKMLRKNFRRYRLYFACNVFCIVLFYCFAALFTNDSFMNIHVTDSMIASNVIAPSMFVAVFMLVFIPYTCHAFMKNRKYEYGVFMTLGMSKQEAIADMLLENSLVAIASLLVGLVIGTVLSFFFFLVVRYAFCVISLRWVFNIRSYLLTAALYAVAMLVSLSVGVVEFSRLKLTDFLKGRFKAEQISRLTGWLFGLGLLLTVSAVLMMALHSGTTIWCLGILILVIGLFLTIFCWKSPKENSVFRQQHLLGFAFVRQHAASGKRLCFFTLWMFAFTAFFAGLCLLFFQMNRQYAFTYHPFDLEYVQDNKNSKMQNEEVLRLLKQSGVTVTSSKQVGFLKNGTFNLYSVSDLNHVFGCNYSVKSGKFLALFQLDLHDGYTYDLTYPQTVSIPFGKKQINLRAAGRDVRILFNKDPSLSYQTLILNDADYQKIAAQSKELWMGTVYLYQFGNWRNSAGGVAAVQNYCWRVNGIPPSERWANEVTSKISAYNAGMHSAGFLIFMLSFVMVLFCVSANLTEHFRICSEQEEEYRILSGLNRAGVTGEELFKTIQFKNLAYFMPQALIGVLAGALCNFTINKSTGLQWEAGGVSVLIGFVLVLLQWALTVGYSKKEWRKFDC